MPNTKRKMGRPRAKIETSQIEHLASMGCTRDEIAAALGVSRSTTFRRLAEPKFAEAIEKGNLKCRLSIRQAQYKKGVKQLHPGLLQWLGKQYLGQRDKVEHTGADGGAIQFESINIDALSIEEALAFRAMLEKMQTPQLPQESAQDVEAVTIATGRVQGKPNGHG